MFSAPKLFVDFYCRNIKKCRFVSGSDRIFNLTDASFHLLLNNKILRLTNLPVLHVLQPLFEGCYVLPVLQQKYAFALVQTCGLTDPNGTVFDAHTWIQTQMRSDKRHSDNSVSYI